MQEAEKSIHRHWSEQLADRVIAEKKEPYVVSSGMTTSGPAHFGTVCEFLFPFTIANMVEKRGKKAKFYLVADILDAFDNIPAPMQPYAAQLQEHLGKPLCKVPDPTGKSASYGDHFLDEVKKLMKKLKIKCRILRVNELYSKGKFDRWAKFFLRKEKKAREIIERTSGRQLPKDFSVIMPICQQCGKIATTRVTSHDSEIYEYACDRKLNYVEGCGYAGKNKISNHQYKIVWRLHWPTWKQILKTSIEGGGVDHFTKGGSEDTCVAITKELMKKQHGIGYRYGFIFIEGQKYSKSKGRGMGVTELLTFIPPEVLKYILLRPDLEENIDIDPTPENMLRAIEEFEEAQELAGKNIAELDRAGRKKALAAHLAGKVEWRGFLNVLLYYQIYRDFGKVSEILQDEQTVEKLAPYVRKWVAKKFLPEDYNFSYQGKKTENKTVAGIISTLDSKMDALAVHNAVYDYTKQHNLQGGEVFRQLYRELIGKDKGPRIGKLIAAIGVARVKGDLLGGKNG